MQPTINGNPNTPVTTKVAKLKPTDSPSGCKITTRLRPITQDTNKDRSPIQWHSTILLICLLVRFPRPTSLPSMIANTRKSAVRSNRLLLAWMPSKSRNSTQLSFLSRPSSAHVLQDGPLLPPPLSVAHMLVGSAPSRT